MLRRHIRGKARGDFIFTSPMGGALSNRNWRRRNFERGMAELVEAHPELTPLTPRDQRHITANVAISVGADVKAAQRMSGHASAAMTVDAYSELSDDEVNAVEAAVSAAGTSEAWVKISADDSSPTKVAVKKRSKSL